MTVVIFFRNDDVGIDAPGALSRELVAVTEVFVGEDVPVSHGVVPGRVTPETARWLLEQKARYPRLLGIDQHGFMHRRHLRGEFGGGRPYAEQLADIARGGAIMEAHFGGAFSRCFTVPWSFYDRHTKRACDDLGYQVFSASVYPSRTVRGRLLQRACRVAGLNVIGRRQVSYHRRGAHGQRGFRIKEVSVSVDLIEDYASGALHDPGHVEEALRLARERFSAVGVMLHHRAWNSPPKLHALRRFLRSIRSDPGLTCRLIEDVPRVSVEHP